VQQGSQDPNAGEREPQSLDVACFAGASPQALWGAGVAGLAPSVVAQTRGAAAKAAGLEAHGHCATTLAGRILGEKRDPEVVAKQAVVEPWIQVAQADPVLCNLTETVWPKIKNAAQGPTRWNRAEGLAAAFRASLQDLGWLAVGPMTWLARGKIYGCAEEGPDAGWPCRLRRT
jgi:hypothetical protein